MGEDNIHDLPNLHQCWMTFVMLKLCEPIDKRIMQVHWCMAADYV